MVNGREGTERCPIYVGPRFGSFCVLLLEKKINNMLLCVKIMLIYIYIYIYIYLIDVLTWKL